ISFLSTYVNTQKAKSEKRPKSCEHLGCCARGRRVYLYGVGRCKQEKSCRQQFARARRKSDSKAELPAEFDCAQPNQTEDPDHWNDRAGHCEPIFPDGCTRGGRCSAETRLQSSALQQR